MKTVLFIHSSSELYGSDKSLLYLIQNLDKSKFKVHVILPEDGPLVEKIKEDNNVTIHIFEVAVLRRKNFSLKGGYSYIINFYNSFKYLSKYIKKNKIDIVYTNTAVVFPGAIAAKINNVKSVWHIREIIKNKAENYIIGKMVNSFSDIIIANSLATGNAICKDKTKMKVIYNAVEEKKNKTNINSNKNNHVYIGMAGRINRWKGQTLFVDAAEIVHSRCPNAKFLIGGSAYKGEEYLLDELNIYISSKNLDNVINTLGQIDDMDSFYDKLDIFVLPSIQPEPFGLVVIEAMEKEIPVIATNHGGPTEIINNNTDGYLVNYNSPDEMADKIIYLINNVNKREIIGKRGQEKKRNMFSLNKTVGEIEQVLLNL